MECYIFVLKLCLHVIEIPWDSPYSLQSSILSVAGQFPLVAFFSYFIMLNASIFAPRSYLLLINAQLLLAI